MLATGAKALEIAGGCRQGNLGSQVVGQLLHRSALAGRCFRPSASDVVSILRVHPRRVHQQDEALRKECWDRTRVTGDRRLGSVCPEPIERRLGVAADAREGPVDVHERPVAVLHRCRVLERRTVLEVELRRPAVGVHGGDEGGKVPGPDEDVRVDTPAGRSHIIPIPAEQLGMQAGALDVEEVYASVLRDDLDARMGETNADVERHQVAHALSVATAIWTRTARPPRAGGSVRLV